MNQINPNKLLLSKWTALNPANKERHFIVSGLITNQEEQIVACKLEALINKKCYEIDWKQLQNNELWQMGWN